MTQWVLELVGNMIVNELIENINVSKDGRISIIFNHQDEFIEVIDFIKREKYDIILKNVL